MKLQTSYLAATTALAFLTSSASAVGPSIPNGPPKRPDGKPTKMENWKWTDPFTKKFDAACSAEKSFPATEYLLDDLSEKAPKGLVQYREALKKVFADREYPGSWDGIDPHGYDRNLLMMEYSAVPVPVREWIEDQERQDSAKGKGLFAVYEKPVGETEPRHTVQVAATPSPIPAALRPLDEKRVVIFAPGALYETLPLWVAESAEGSDCKEALSDIAKYSPKPTEGAVVAYPVKKTKAQRRQGKRDMEFTIKAQVVKQVLEEEAAAAEPVVVNEKEEL
ncbi:hypothetical protein B0H66DRAFT_583330 [Apodospora peruviana]|uniref:Uncharacterized protein n=1 Tax=Apodospora peruviana TaxID=516989 RepID=A0AAE0I1V8_9PEZI|nr:hypothetical protein B0H66DRAFT_583330 [Apodospora peruviana]